MSALRNLDPFDDVQSVGTGAAADSASLVLEAMQTRVKLESFSSLDPRSAGAVQKSSTGSSDTARPDDIETSASLVAPLHRVQESLARARAVSAIQSSRVEAMELPITRVLAEWHGQVLSIEDDYLNAELKGTIGGGVAGMREQAQIPLDEVRDEDKELLREGAFFRLCVNYEVRNGSRRRYTEVVFRRMPAYRRDELEEAIRNADTLWNAIRVE